MTSAAEPKLAPPGAGLPFVELNIVRLLFGLKRRLGKRRSFEAQFKMERRAIHAMVKQCNPESGAYRVLIGRPVGLEDSSRYWSVWMTLDHLRIVHRAIAGIIPQLSNGVIPEGKVSTADVKPSTGATIAVLPEYEQSCDALLNAFAACPDLRTRARFTHPWFGPLDAAGWHALGAGHMSIHRVQMERIMEGLPSRA